MSDGHGPRPATDMLRLFIAVELSREMQAALDQVLAGLRKRHERSARWVRSDHIHLTLKFLGETPAEQVPAIVQAMERAADGASPFTVGLGEAGAFPTLHNPRALWVGARTAGDTLARLQQRIDEECHRLGFPREERSFTAHLTLGRVRPGLGVMERRRLGEAMAACRIEPVEQRVEGVSLMRSTLLPEGAVYQRLAWASLSAVT